MRSVVSTTILLMLFASASVADTLLVPSQYSTINAACEAAANGDTIAVAPGRYDGTCAHVPAGVFILGLGDGPGEVQVRQAGCQAFYFESGVASSRLENLEVQGIVGIRNNNNGLIIRTCRLLDESYYSNRLVKTNSDVRLESCWLGCMFEATALIFLEESANVDFCDCMIGQASTAFCDHIPPGSDISVANCTFMGPVFVWPENAYWAQYAIYFVNCIMPEGTCRTIVPDTMEWRYNDFTDVGCEYPLGTYLIGNFTADPLFCGPTDFRIDYESPCRGAGEGGEDVGARLGYCNVPQGVRRDSRNEVASLWISPVWPNPTRAGAVAAYRGKPNELIDIRLVDVRGRVIDEQRCVATGTHQLYRWDGRDAKGHLVPGGAYFLEFQGGNEGVAKRILVIR